MIGGFIARLFGRAEQDVSVDNEKGDDITLRRLTVRDPDGWYPDEMRSNSGEVVGAQSALALSSVWACVNLLAGTGASLPLELRRRTKAGNEIAYDHSLFRVLHDSPNYDQTALDFWEFMFASIELWGSAYAHILRSSTGIAGLMPITPQCMSVRRRADGTIEYRWSENGKSYVESDQDVFHIRGFGGDPLGGMSTLHFARNTFGLAQAIEKTTSAMFKNGIRASGVLTMPNVLKTDQRDDIEKGLQTKFMGAMNAGRPMVLEGGVTWQTLTIPPEDAQMLESRGFSVEEICRFFGVPPFMVGRTEKSTSWGTGLEQQTLGFLKFTLRRRLKRIEQAIAKQLLTPQDRVNGIYVAFNIEALLRADSAGRSKFYQTMTAIGAMTINEVRALEGLPPVEGGDVPRMQMQNVPITEADSQVGKIAAPADNEE
jgi:HK97 family phage portal protein